MGVAEDRLVAEVTEAIRMLKQLPPGGVPGPLTVADRLQDALNLYIRATAGRKRPEG